MKRSRFSEEEIIGILREAEAGSPIKSVFAAHTISRPPTAPEDYGEFGENFDSRFRGDSHNLPVM